jgi:hypothetical protein
VARRPGSDTPSPPRPIAPESSKAPVAATQQKRGGKPRSREGKIHIGAYVSPDFKRSLRLVQAQTGEDVQTLLTRALNDLFKSHNVPVVDQE